MSESERDRAEDLMRWMATDGSIKVSEMAFIPETRVTVSMGAMLGVLYLHSQEGRGVLEKYGKNDQTLLESETGSAWMGEVTELISWGDIPLLTDAQFNKLGEAMSFVVRFYGGDPEAFEEGYFRVVSEHINRFDLAYEAYLRGLSEGDPERVFESTLTHWRECDECFAAVKGTAERRGPDSGAAKLVALVGERSPKDDPGPHSGS